MKFYMFAPATVTAVLLALTSYSVDIDNSVRDVIGVPHVGEAVEQAPAATVAPAGEAPAAAQVTAAQTAEMNEDESAQQTPAANPIIQRTVKVEKGDSLGALLTRGGIDAGEIVDVSVALTRTLDPRDLKPGQAFNLTFQKDDDGLHLVSLDTTPDPERSISLRALPEGGFKASEIKAHLSTAERVGYGTIDGSLYDAGYKAKLPPQILAAFIRAYSYSVDFQRDLQPGDKFMVLYEVVVNDKGDVVRPGNILAAFLRLGDKAQRIYLNHTAEGSLEFFSPDGHSIRRTLLRTPVDGARITSGFGMRMHPLLGYTKMHKGIDFGAPPGTPVFAAGDGVIEKMGWWGGYGKYIRIRHNSDTGTAYAHLSRFNPNLSEGSRVRQGQIIAFTGSTGASTGPHLHFEVLKHGVQVNPLTQTASLGDALEGRDMAQFKHLMDQRDQEIRELIKPTEVATRNVINVSKVE